MDTLKTILYFSIFNYPLKLEEICSFSPSKNLEKVQSELDELISKKIISKIEDYYLIGNDVAHIQKRKNGNKMAKEVLVKAKERAAFIAKFPFVEAVGVSGSLSKGYYDKDCDFDFFIIATPNRVWVCRTLLMLYKKIFLLNSRKYFCVNYFISSSNLEINEKNRFTATEIKTLLPFQGKKAFQDFYEHNLWVSDIFGEFIPSLESVENSNKPTTTIFLEAIFQTKLGSYLDFWFREITVAFWKLKFKKITPADFKIALKSTKEVSKHHPLNFQKRVLTALNEKYEDIKKNHNIELTKEYV